MTIEKELITEINKILPELPVFWAIATDEAKTPYIVMQWIGGAGDTFIDNETIGGYQRHLQVTVWDKSYSKANDYIQMIKKQLDKKGNIKAISAPIDLYDTGDHGSTLDFSILC